MRALQNTLGHLNHFGSCQMDAFRALTNALADKRVLEILFVGAFPQIETRTTCPCFADSRAASKIAMTRRV